MDATVIYCDHRVHTQIRKARERRHEQHPAFEAKFRADRKYEIQAFCDLCGLAGNWYPGGKFGIPKSSAERRAIASFYKAANLADEGKHLEELAR
jgi:hypothetical protein